MADRDVRNGYRQAQRGADVSTPTPGKATSVGALASATSSSQVDGTNGIYAPPGNTWAIGPAGAGSAQSETPQTDADHERKAALAKKAYDFGYDTFLIFLDAANDAIKLISTPELPKTDNTKQLIGFAASALLGAGAGAVTAWFVGAVTTAGLAAKAGGTAAGMVSGAVKNALTSADAAAATSVADVKQAFADTYKVQLDASRRDYIGRQDQLGAALSLFDVDQLRLLVDALRGQSTAPLRAKMKHETMVAWTNFLARAKHGAAGWDYWAPGGNGSPGAMALPGAEPRPNEGGLDHSNIRASGSSPLLETTQRPMQDDPFGVLEVFCWSDGHVVDLAGYRMRLDNVGPKVREEFRGAGRVRDLKVNKVIHLCSYHHNGVDVDPPATIGAVLVTADGYVRARNWGGNDRGIYDFASAAQELPLTWLRG